MALSFFRRRASPDDALAIDRLPPLAWRKPAFAWTPAALIIGIGWPYLVLRNEGGVALMAAFGAAGVGLGGVLVLLAAARAGRPPRTRRTALSPFILLGLAAGFVLPLLFAILLAILNAIERNQSEVALKNAGLGVDMVLALWPLGIMIGLPYALFVGLSVVLIALRAPDAPAPDSTALTSPAARDIEPLF
ncbi:MAG: hypothetical protein NW203_04245 [Hyphomonadaceae bacterium]|nr:hypothetical protein [Hyphomonadaceae bacterium]